MVTIMRYFFSGFLVIFWGVLLLTLIRSLDNVKVTIAIEQPQPVPLTPPQKLEHRGESLDVTSMPPLPLVEKPRWDLGLPKDSRFDFQEGTEIPVIEPADVIKSATFQDKIEMILDNHLIPILLKIEPKECRACNRTDRRMMLQIKMADAFRRGDTKTAGLLLKELERIDSTRQKP